MTGPTDPLDHQRAGPDLRSPSGGRDSTAASVVRAWLGEVAARRLGRPTTFSRAAGLAGSLPDLEFAVTGSQASELYAALEVLAAAEADLADLSEPIAAELGLVAPRDVSMVLSVLRRLENPPSTERAWWTSADPDQLQDELHGLRARADMIDRRRERVHERFGDEADADVVAVAGRFAAWVHGLFEPPFDLPPELDVGDLPTLLAFAEETARAVEEIEELARTAGAVFGADLTRLRLGAALRFGEAVAVLALLPPAPAAWADDEHAALARASWTAVAPRLAAVRAVDRAVDERFHETVRTLDPDGASIVDLVRHSRAGRIDDVDGARALLRESRRGREGLASLHGVAVRHLGDLWQDHATDPAVVDALLDARDDLRAALGVQWNAEQVRSVLPTGAFATPEFDRSVLDYVRAVQRWHTAAERAGLGSLDDVVLTRMRAFARRVREAVPGILEAVEAHVLFDRLDTPLLELASDLQDAVEVAHGFHDDVADAQRRLGPSIRGVDTDWDDVAHRLDWVVRLRWAWAGGRVPDDVVQRIERRDLPVIHDLVRAAELAQRAADSVDDLLDELRPER